MVARHSAQVTLEGDWVYVSRTHGVGDAGNAADSIREQTRRALRRIEAALGAHRLTLSDVAQARYLIPHGASADALLACRDLIFAAWADRLPRPTFIAAGLAHPGALIEIEARARCG